MISAFFGADGRIDATHASLALADVHAALDEAVTLVRFTLPDEARLPSRIPGTGPVQVIERTAGTTTAAIAEIARASGEGRHAVLDLPASWLADPTLRRSLDVAVIAVGPAPLDEHAAGHALAAEGRASLGPADGGGDPPWLLACDRAGGAPAATAFARRMAGLAADFPAGAAAPRILPVTLPPLTHAEASRLMEGGRSARVLSAGIFLWAALRAVWRDPWATALDAGGLATAIGIEDDAVRLLDERQVGDRLRDLADALEAIRDGYGPTRGELDDGPVLDDWKVESAPVRILTGRVHGHPNIPDGRRIATSSLYATDGVSYARTLSRTYALGRPAEPGAGSGPH